MTYVDTRAPSVKMRVKWGGGGHDCIQRCNSNLLTFRYWYLIEVIDEGCDAKRRPSRARKMPLYLCGDPQNSQRLRGKQEKMNIAILFFGDSV